PLAESLPWRGLKRLTHLYGVEEFFSHGKSSVLLDEIAIPSICYEELFSYTAREGRSQGGSLLINVTNDGWYPNSTLPEQHFTQGLIRSVENGVPLVRACNSGVTAAVDSLGRVVARLGEKGESCQFQSGVLFAHLSSKEYTTIFSICGDIPVLLICSVFVFLNFCFSLSRYFHRNLRPCSRNNS
ncbi:MAG: hypothetical protein FJZ58_07390, partial [Chlamydiae bacterium]|nr:hypothetical protein [Chlamydiota bacterium]